MGTELMNPQDFLVERIRVAPAVFHSRKICYGNGYPRSDIYVRKPVMRKEEMKMLSSQPGKTISKRSPKTDELRPAAKSTNSNRLKHHYVTGQVMILRRGESLDSMIKAIQPSPPKKAGEDLIVSGTGRLGPDPDMVPKQIWTKELKSVEVNSGIQSDEYAGSAFSMSPSPSCLPLPTFFNKKQGSKSFDDSATRDLRRLLRLE